MEWERQLTSLTFRFNRKDIQWEDSDLSTEDALPSDQFGMFEVTVLC